MSGYGLSLEEAAERLWDEFRRGRIVYHGPFNQQDLETRCRFRTMAEQLFRQVILRDGFSMGVGKINPMTPGWQSNRPESYLVKRV